MNSEEKTKHFPRIVPLLAGVIIQLCLGTVYIWGVFQPYVMQTFGWETLTASMTFSIVLGFFVLGSIVGGRIQDKTNPQVVIFSGGLILGAGIFLASFTPAANPFYLYLTYGFMGGFGMGMTYTTIIACCQKWFRDKMGLATGIVVASLGFGGFIFTPLAKLFLSTAGVPSTFVYFAIIFTVVCVAGSFFLKNPPKDYLPKGAVQKAQKRAAVDYNAGQMLKTPSFYAITISLLLAVPAYFIISPILVIIGEARGLSPEAAVAGVMIASLLNSAGRLVGPWISDRLGRKKTIYLLMIGTIAAILVFIAAQSYLILGLTAVIAFCYGGYLGIYPALTSEYYGMKNAGVNYGIVLVGFGIAAIFTPIMARMVNSGENYTMSFIIAATLAGIAMIVAIFIKRPRQT